MFFYAKMNQKAVCIFIGRKAKPSYIMAINYELRIKNNHSVRICAAGKKRLTLLNILYDMRNVVDVLSWSQQMTEVGGLELCVHVALKDKNATNKTAT